MTAKEEQITGIDLPTNVFQFQFEYDGNVASRRQQPRTNRSKKTKSMRINRISHKNVFTFDSVTYFVLRLKTSCGRNKLLKSVRPEIDEHHHRLARLLLSIQLTNPLLLTDLLRSIIQAHVFILLKL